MRCPLHAGLAVLFLLGALGGDPALAQTAQPRLVLVIIVDQLRGDMPGRFEDRLGPGGFRYFMENGTVFSNANFCHVTTVTAAGHATLATGGNPPQHGIAGNDWFDMASQQVVYNTEDRRYPVIGDPPGSKEGRSPENLKSSTFGDELVRSSGGRSRVFSVSIKDRSAILLGGRQGKAFWYSRSSGGFVTSTYYYGKYPDWVQNWNQQGHADRYRNQTWDLLLDRDSYVFKDQDDRAFERVVSGLGRTFPHSLEKTNQEKFYSTLRRTPMGDQLTLEFVKALFVAEKVGQEDSTDVLAISFSATDYIGHQFGPNSLEAEDNLLRLDRTLQELLEFIDQQTGLSRTLVVLSSDHGVSPAPEFMAAQGISAERIGREQFMPQANLALQKTFNTSLDLVRDFWSPSLYLDLDAIESLGLEVAQVEHELAAFIMTLPGFSLALAKSDILAGRIPETAQARRLACGVDPDRSGNVIVVQDPYWYLSREPQGDAATHGSSYSYDTHVPIMMTGPGIGSGTVSSPVSPHDVAPTISDYLGVSPPSGSIGVPLPLIPDPKLTRAGTQDE